MSDDSSEPEESLAGKLFAVLETFDAAHSEQRLEDIASRVRVPAPTVHRMVSELVDLGALTRISADQYALGQRLAELGLLARADTDLKRIARPFLEDVHAATDALVHLAVRDGTRVVYLVRVEGTSSVKLVSTVGSRVPLHATGVGKVLLAYAPQPIQEEVFSRRERITSQTVVHPNRLRAELTRIRSHGYSQTTNEMSLGNSSVAVPIYGTDNKVIASIGVVVAELRSEKARLVTALWMAARGIHRRLGFTPASHPQITF